MRLRARRFGVARRFSGLGLLFRLQEYLIAFPWAPWTTCCAWMC